MSSLEIGHCRIRVWVGLAKGQGPAPIFQLLYPSPDKQGIPRWASPENQDHKDCTHSETALCQWLREAGQNLS